MMAETGRINYRTEQIIPADVVKQRSEKIAALIEGHGVRDFIKLATEDLLPAMITERREYLSICRKLIYTHDYKDSRVEHGIDLDKKPYCQYMFDMSTGASVLSLDEQPSVHNIEHPEVLRVPLGAIATELEKINEMRMLTQRYDYLARMQELATWAVARTEDTHFKTLIDARISSASMSVSASSDTAMTKDHLVALQRKIIDNGGTVKAFVMSDSRRLDIELWDHSELDDTTRLDVQNNGPLYKIWSIPIIVLPTPERASERVWLDNQVYAFGAPEDVGRMPELMPLTIQTSDRVDEKLEYSMVGREYYGMAIVKSNACARLDLHA